MSRSLLLLTAERALVTSPRLANLVLLPLLLAALPLPTSDAVPLISWFYECGGKANLQVACGAEFVPVDVPGIPHITHKFVSYDTATAQGFYDGLSETLGYWAGQNLVYTPAFVTCIHRSGTPTCIGRDGFGVCVAACKPFLVMTAGGYAERHPAGSVLSYRDPWLGCIGANPPDYARIMAHPPPPANNPSGLTCMSEEKPLCIWPICDETCDSVPLERLRVISRLVDPCAPPGCQNLPALIGGAASTMDPCDAEVPTCEEAFSRWSSTARRGADPCRLPPVGCDRLAAGIDPCDPTIEPPRCGRLCPSQGSILGIVGAPECEDVAALVRARGGIAPSCQPTLFTPGVPPAVHAPLAIG